MVADDVAAELGGRRRRGGLGKHSRGKGWAPVGVAFLRYSAGLGGETGKAVEDPVPLEWSHRGSVQVLVSVGTLREG